MNHQIDFGRVALLALVFGYLLGIPFWVCISNELLDRKRRRDAKAWQRRKETERVARYIALQEEHRAEFRRRQSTPPRTIATTPTPAVRRAASELRRANSHLN